MPPTNGVVDLLVPKKTLRRSEWCAIIDARVELIKPYLDLVTLQHYREMRCLMQGSGALYELGDKVKDCEGLFYYDITALSGRAGVRRPEGEYSILIWLLDRKGRWQGREIKVIRSRRGSQPFDGVIDDRASHFASTDELLTHMEQNSAYNASGIFKMLGDNIASIIQRRRSMLGQLEGLEFELKLQDRVLETRMS